MMVGTTLIHVHWCSATSDQKFEAEKRCGITTDPPWTSGATVVTIWPLMW